MIIVNEKNSNANQFELINGNLKLSDYLSGFVQVKYKILYSEFVGQRIEKISRFNVPIGNVTGLGSNTVKWSLSANYLSNINSFT